MAPSWRLATDSSGFVYLLGDSPCIDAGVSDGSGPPDDFERQPRSNGQPDIGPDEL